MQTLRLFCDVAAHRSFSRAAALHGITQSAVSQRVHQLEKKLGVVLLDRSVRPPALTAAGELFTREARQIVDHYDDLTERVAQIEGRVKGDVTVAAIYSAGIDLLHTLREGFQAEHPTVHIHLEYKRPEEVDHSVREGTCDFGIVSYPASWRGMSVRPLRDERMSVVCAPGHALATRERLEARELDGLEMIGFDSALPVGRHIRRYLKAERVKTVFTQGLDNIDTLKSVLAISNAVAILPRRTVGREVDAGTLATVELEPALNRPLGIIYTRSPRLSRAAIAFQDFLVENAEPDLQPLEDSAVASAGRVSVAT
ncbi:MAG: LysR family transcriptional regulator [Acidobacteriota bacterium]|nr:LysR family transcriptional regulator [Acidobacteriota bacterium]